MKLRIGFVSNSSTSSFFLIVTAEAHKNAMKQLEKWERDVVNCVMEKDTFAGQEVYVGGEYSDAGSGGTLEAIEKGQWPSKKPIDFPDNPDESDENYWEFCGHANAAWEKYQELIPKDQKSSCCVSDGG